jgi:hypothetical protein
MKPRNRTLTILVLVTLIAVTIAYVLPVYVVLVTSLKTPVEIPPFIAFSVTALCALIGGLGSYCLSRARTAFSRFISSWWALGCIYPHPLVQLMAKKGLDHSLAEHRPQPAQRERFLAANRPGIGDHPGCDVRPVAPEAIFYRQLSGAAGASTEQWRDEQADAVGDARLPETDEHHLHSALPPGPARYDDLGCADPEMR